MRALNTLPVQFKGYYSCYRIQNWEFSVPLQQGHKIIPCRNENSYRVTWHIFWKYNSPYLIETDTYVLIDLLWAGGSVAPAQSTSLRWNRGISAQTCSTCLEGPYKKESSGAYPCREIDRAWEPRIPSPCSLMAIIHATESKIGSSLSQIGIGAQNTTL